MENATDVWDLFDNTNRVINEGARTIINYKTAVADIERANNPQSVDIAGSFEKLKSGAVDSTMMIIIGGVLLAYVALKK